MRKEYDLSKMERVPNPYFEKLSKEITFRLDFDSIDYFKKLGEPYGLPPEDMIRMYMQRIAATGYKVNFDIPTLKERGKA